MSEREREEREKFVFSLYSLLRDRDSSVSTVTKQQTARARNRVPVSSSIKRLSCAPEPSRPALAPTDPLLQCAPGVLSSAAKRSEREAAIRPFPICLHGVHQDNFTVPGHPTANSHTYLKAARKINLVVYKLRNRATINFSAF